MRTSAFVRDMRAQRAYRGALISALLNAFGAPLELLLNAGVPHLPKWPFLFSGAVGALVAIGLVVRQGHKSVRVATWAFLVNNAAILVWLWVMNGVLASQAQWVPFQANKLGALAVSLLAPELWSGAICVVGFAGSAMVQYMTFSAATRERVLLGEPWTTFFYGVFGVALLFQNLRGRAVELVLVRTEIERAASELLAQRLMAIRDLANTPLQTIELTSALLRGRAVADGDLDRIDRASVRLRELNRILVGLEGESAKE